MFTIDLPHSATPVYFPQQAYKFERVQQRPPETHTLFPSQSVALRAEVSEAKTKIREFGQMPENWDGYDALGISAEATRNALVALDSVLRAAPIPDIVPNPNGTLSFEWETADGFAHLEVGNTRFAFYLKRRSDQPSRLSGSAEQVPSGLGYLVAALLYPARSTAGTITKITMSNDVRAAA